MSNFNFANPAWLWGLLLIPAAFLWHKYVKKRHVQSGLHTFIDPKLLPHILVKQGGTTNTMINSGWLQAIAVICTILALANPRWSFTDTDAYQPMASMVILFDLSDADSVSMARQQVEDLLNHSQGLKVGLVAFSGIAHMVAPITDDLRTVRTFLPALDTDIVAKHGDNLQAALLMAGELLSHEPGNNKSVLLVSSGIFTNKNYNNAINKLTKNDIDLFVLGVGDQNVNILKSIAKSGHGMYVAGDHTEKAVNSILYKVTHKYDTKEIVAGKIRQWDEKYYLLLVPVALLFMYLFRHGALLLLLFCFAIPEAQAAEIFRNADQQALQQFKQTNFDEAAELFTKDYNQGVALYRAGKYADAENSFKKDASISGIYNAGNSQMQQQKWHAAIKSYETVLAANPKHLDAKHNLEIARGMLEDSEQVNEEQTEQQEEVQSRDQETDKVDSDIQNEESSEGIQGNRDMLEGGEQGGSTDQRLNQEMQESNDIRANEQQEIDDMQKQEDIDQKMQTTPGADGSEQNNGSELWLNRVDSDIKVLLRNKFYIESVLSEQQ